MIQSWDWFDEVPQYIHKFQQQYPAKFELLVDLILWIGE